MHRGVPLSHTPPSSRRRWVIDAVSLRDLSCQYNLTVTTALELYREGAEVPRGHCGVYLSSLSIIM
jgi:hypothetical protein